MIIGFMYGYVFIKILKIAFYTAIAVCAIRVALTVYQYAKELYVFRHIDDVDRIAVLGCIQLYREQMERSGVSIGRYITTHYRIKRVPYKKIWRVKAYFRDGRCLKFEIREHSKIYDKIVIKI